MCDWTSPATQDKEIWICISRVQLLKDILADTPEAKGRLLIDLINEPDGYTLTWEVLLLFLAHVETPMHEENAPVLTVETIQ